MKKHSVLYVISSLLLLLPGCGQYCPKLSDSLQQYFPYNEGMTLKYTNESGEEKILTANAVSVDKAITLPWHCMCLCDEGNEFKLVDSDILSVQGRISSHYPMDQMVFFSMSIQENAEIKDDFGKNKEIVNQISENPAELFGDTLVFHGDYYADVTIVYGKGLVSFKDLKTGKTWRLVE